GIMLGGVKNCCVLCIFASRFFSPYFLLLSQSYTVFQPKFVTDIFPDLLFEFLQLHRLTLHLSTIKYWVFFDSFYDVH
ncbi:hypothetical protein ALC62_06256, partial [Cyphomyrmex costatus]